MTNVSSSADMMVADSSAEGDLEAAFSTINRMGSEMNEQKVKHYPEPLPYWVQQWARVTRLVLGIKAPIRRGGMGRRLTLQREKKDHKR